MGRLVLNRRVNEQVRLTLRRGASVDSLLDQLEDEGIWITVAQIEGGRARLVIDAPDELLVLRDELVERYEQSD
ncbi:carbon storage regulator [Stutzerimonas zhaodongensis]|uniref:carbon storage regulator n=1 Tax=Stutzerimonas zhaodongensis TaxID=1176257 RepID=UPI0039EFB967